MHAAVSSQTDPQPIQYAKAQISAVVARATPNKTPQLGFGPVGTSFYTPCPSSADGGPGYHGYKTSNRVQLKQQQSPR